MQNLPLDELLNKQKENLKRENINQFKKTDHTLDIESGTEDPLMGITNANQQDANSLVPEGNRPASESKNIPTINDSAEDNASGASGVALSNNASTQKASQNKQQDKNQAAHGIL